MELVWLNSQPKNPVEGNIYFDSNTGCSYIYCGNMWMIFSSDVTIPLPSMMAPTSEQLEKHPALKEAWEELMVIRKLLGV